MLVKELIEELSKCDPDARVRIWFDNEITDVVEVGGRDSGMMDVRIWHSGIKDTRS